MFLHNDGAVFFCDQSPAEYMRLRPLRSFFIANLRAHETPHTIFRNPSNQFRCHVADEREAGRAAAATGSDVGEQSASA